MIPAALSRLWLVLGAFGGELVLLAALPWLGHQQGHAAIAQLGVAIATATAGKLVGCLKLDAALTDASAYDVGAVHILAALAASTTTVLVAGVLLFLVTIGALPDAVADAAPACAVAFAAGAAQQAATMRLLREDKLGWFAAVKALPSLLIVGLAIVWPQAELLHTAQAAWLLTIVVCAALHLKPGSVDGLRVALRQRSRSLRPYVLKGAPAATLDAANLFMLSVFTVHAAGVEAAGQATQLQRIALAPSLAASMLLAQVIWRQRFVGSDASAQARARQSFASAARCSAAAAAASIAVLFLLLSPFGSRAVAVAPENRALVAACLAPLLSQYAGSPLTVYFFKRQRLTAYAGLQVALLAMLALAAGCVTWSIAPGSVALAAVAVVSLFLTVALSRSTVVSVST